MKAKIKKVIEKIKNGWINELLAEMRWIYQYGMRYKRSVIWYICLGVFGILMGLGASIISKYIIDAVTGKNAEKLLLITAAYIVVQILYIASHVWTGKTSAKIQLKVNQEIRADVYDKIMSTDWEALSEFHSGDLLNRIDKDVNSVSESVIGWVPNFCTNILQFVGALTIIVYYDATLALLALISAPVTIIMSRFFIKKITTYNKKLRQVGSDVIVFNEESLYNIQTIKSFGLAKAYGEKLRAVQKNYCDLKMQYTEFTLKTSAFMSGIGMVVGMSCMGWGIYRLWTGNITFGTMVLFIQMSRTLSNVFQKLIQMVPSVISAATAAGRIMTVSELKKESYDNKEEVDRLLDSKEGIVVEATQMNFYYGPDKKVFENETFIAKPGELVAVVGESGAGKTTLLRILLGLMSARRGEVTMSGEYSGNKIHVNAATRDLCSYVPQDNTMFSGTVAENMRAVKSDATDEEINNALKIACAYDFIYNDSAGLESQIKEKGGGFSEGQIQRLSIARAVLADKPVLLLDEATSALDMATEQRVLTNIMNFRGNKTCIVTTHRPSVLDMCSRIYRIQNSMITIVK